MLAKAFLALVLVLSIEALPVPVSGGIPESFSASNISFPVYNHSLPVNNISLPAYNNSLPMYNGSLPNDVNDAINRDDPLWPLPNISLPVYNFSFPLYNNSLPVYNFSLPVYNNSLPVNNNSLPVNNHSLPWNNFSIPARPELPGPIDVMKAINRDDMLWPLPNISIPVYNNSLSTIFNISSPLLVKHNVTIDNDSFPPRDIEELKRDDLPQPLTNNSLPVYNNSLPAKNNSFPMDISSLPVNNNSLPVFNFSRPANNMSIPVNNNISLPTYNFSIPAPQELPISPRVMEEISREYLPRPLSGFQAMMNSLERTGGKFPFGVQKQERQDNPGEKSPMDRREGFKCYYGKEIVTVQQDFCSLALHIVKRANEKIDCDMKYLVKSKPNFGNKNVDDLEFFEEETNGLQTIHVHCRCSTPLCNAEENFNQCLLRASEVKVFRPFNNNRNYNDLLKCIYKKTGRYPVHTLEDFSVKNLPMEPLKCYYGNDYVVRGGENYCGLEWHILKRDTDEIDCVSTFTVRQTPSLYKAEKDLMILENRRYGFQSITIQCKCYTPLCNTRESLNRCMKDAFERNNFYIDVQRADDLRVLRNCFANNKKSDDGARMLPQESFRSIDGSAFASMKNGNGMADDASSSVEPMREHSDEWRAETARDSNIADAGSARSSEDSKNM